jgi:superfamily II DNA or RNA helicase
MVNEERLIIQNSALDKLEEVNYNGGVIMPTGTGKSYILIEALKRIYKHGDSILYCADNRKLRDEDFPNELTKWGGELYLPIMERYCYQSAYKFEGKHYNILLMDEGDYALTDEYIKLLKNNTFDHIIFVSATLSQDKRALIEEFVPLVYERKMSDLEGKDIVNTAKLYFVNYMLNSTENKQYLQYNEVFKRELNKDKPNRFTIQMAQQGRKRFLGGLVTSQKICHKLMKKLYTDSEKNKVLIFCLLSQQADDICKYSYHSKNAKDNNFLRMFDEGEIRILSVVGKIDRGVNLTGVNNIIFEAPAESETKLVQKSGRGRRLEVDDTLSIYFLVPFYKDRKGRIQPTVVQKWVYNSTKQLGLPIETIKL